MSCRSIRRELLIVSLDTSAIFRATGSNSFVCGSPGIAIADGRSRLLPIARASPWSPSASPIAAARRTRLMTAPFLPVTLSLRTFPEI